MLKLVGRQAKRASVRGAKFNTAQWWQVLLFNKTRCPDKFSVTKLKALEKNL